MKKTMLGLLAVLVMVGVFTTSGFASVMAYNAGTYSNPDATTIAQRGSTDLDHYYYYVWTIQDVSEAVSGLNVVFHSIRNWTMENNWLNVYLFDLPNATAASWTRGADNQSTTKPDWAALYDDPAHLGTWSYNGVTRDVVFSIDGAVLSALSNGNFFGIGIDPDCHFYDRGITVETLPNAPVPEPMTLVLLGSGLIGAGVFRKKIQA